MNCGDTPQVCGARGPLISIYESMKSAGKKLTNGFFHRPLWGMDISRLDVRSAMHKGPKVVHKTVFQFCLSAWFAGRRRSDSIVELLEHGKSLQTNRMASLHGGKQVELLHGGIPYTKQSILGGYGQHSSSILARSRLLLENHWRLRGLSSSRAWQMASWFLGRVPLALRPSGMGSRIVSHKLLKLAEIESLPPNMKYAATKLGLSIGSFILGVDCVCNVGGM